MLQSLFDLIPADVGLWGYAVVLVAAASESALLLGLVIPLAMTINIVAGLAH